RTWSRPWAINPSRLPDRAEQPRLRFGNRYPQRFFDVRPVSATPEQPPLPDGGWGHWHQSVRGWADDRRRAGDVEFRSSGADRGAASILRRCRRGSVPDQQFRRYALSAEAA